MRRLFFIILLSSVPAMGQVSTQQRVVAVNSTPATCRANSLYKLIAAPFTLWTGGAAGVCTVVGAGDVAGPASSTDNAISRFNGTDGRSIQNSSASIDDSGNLTATNILLPAPGSSVSFQNGNAIGYVDGTGVRFFDNTNLSTLTINLQSLTIGRTLTAPDADSKIPVFGQTITFAGPSAPRTVTLPDENFTVVGLASTQTLTNKTLTSPVLTTPALGVASSTSESITGTGGAGFLQIANQSSAPATPTSAGRLFFDNSGQFNWLRSDGFTRTFSSTITANRIYTWPDADITVAGINRAQTFSTTQTITPGTNVAALKINPSGSQTVNLIEVTSDGTNIRFRLDSAGRIGSRGAHFGNNAESATLSYDAVLFGATAVIDAQATGSFIRLSANANFGFNSSNNNPNGSAVDTKIERHAAGIFGLTSSTIKLGDPGTKPTCDATNRGVIWHDYGGAGVKDTVEVCAKDAGDVYAWRTIY